MPQVVTINKYAIWTQSMKYVQTVCTWIDSCKNYLTLLFYTTCITMTGDYSVSSYSYICQVINSLKHVKDKYGTIQDPGQSVRPSWGAGVVVVVILALVGGLGLGRGLDGVTPDAPPLLWWPRVLSQHTDPRWQLDVWAMRTDGRSQNAAMMLMRQKPGQRGSCGCEVVLGRLERRQPTLINDHTIKHPFQLNKLFTFYIPMSQPHHTFISYPLTTRSTVS